MDVSIIIINYKTYELTCHCIDSVLQYVQGISYEIVLVENGTGEFNAINTARWGDKVKLVVSEQNLGFAGGNNLGVTQADGDYILLLNSDTYLTEDAVSKTLYYIRSQPRAGVVSAKLVYPDGRPQSAAQRFPELQYKLIELFRLQKLLSKKAAGRLLLGAFFDHQETVKVDWVWGAFFMFTRRILDQLPGQKLDDTYFMYWEDVQWCKDISRLGYEIHFYAGTEVVHLLGGSSGKKNAMMEENGKLFFRKNYSALYYRLIKLLDRWISL